jgi:hypothetical protein
MYEHRTEALLTRTQFLRRLLGSFAVTLLIAGLSLAVGTSGYHIWGGLHWLDSFYNASMILTGMGPVDPITTARGKLFASFYALYSGIAFLSMAAVMVAPIVHRILHKFHLAEEDE